VKISFTLWWKPEITVFRLYVDRFSDMGKFVWAFLELLVANMTKIEFLQDKAVAFHAKGLRLPYPLETCLFASLVHHLLQSQNL
jgi:hypothetical protein